MKTKKIFSEVAFVIAFIGIMVWVILSACGPITTTFTKHYLTPIVGSTTKLDSSFPVTIDFTVAGEEQPIVVAAYYKLNNNVGGGGSLILGFDDDILADCDLVLPTISIMIPVGVDTSFTDMGAIVIAELNNRTSGIYLMCVRIIQDDLGNPVDFELETRITGEFTIGG